MDAKKRRGLVGYALSLLEESREAGDEMTNAFGIGQVNTTLLAETLADDCGMDELDDDSSLVWDAAFEAARKYERKYGIVE